MLRLRRVIIPKAKIPSAPIEVGSGIGFKLMVAKNASGFPAALVPKLTMKRPLAEISPAK